MFLGTFCAPLIAVYFFHFGPLGVGSGDDVLCAELSLTNGSKLCVVAHRTGEFIDAYHVTLYLIEVNGEVLSYNLGDEDSFWWATSLRLGVDKKEIEIRSFGQFVAKYLIAEKSVAWADGKLPSEYGRRGGDAIVRKLNLIDQP